MNFQIASFGEDSPKTPLLFNISSFSHLVWGIFMAIFIKKFKLAKDNYTLMLLVFSLHTIYEIKDIYFSYINVPDKNSKYYWNANNSFINSIGDTIFNLIGAYATTFLIKEYPQYLNELFRVFLLIVAIYCRILKIVT